MFLNEWLYPFTAHIINIHGSGVLVALCGCCMAGATWNAAVMYIYTHTHNVTSYGHWWCIYTHKTWLVMATDNVYIHTQNVTSYGHWWCIYERSHTGKTRQDWQTKQADWLNDKTDKTWQDKSDKTSRQTRQSRQTKHRTVRHLNFQEAQKLTQFQVLKTKLF